MNCQCIIGLSNLSKYRFLLVMILLAERPSCMEIFTVNRVTNLETGEIKVNPHPNTCQRYQCMKCYKVRLGKSLRRLRSVGLKYKYKNGDVIIKPFKVKRFVHATVGIHIRSIDDVSRTKKYMEKVLVKFHSHMRKLYLFRGLRVFDMSKDPETGEWFVHFHYALMPEKGRKFSTSIMNSVISKISGGKIKVFKIIGLRYLDEHWVHDKKGEKLFLRKGLFGYFAKRMSGYFGHKEHGNNFYLEEVMEWEEADKIFLHMRKLVVFSPSVAGLGSNSGNNSPRKNHIIVEFLGISFNIKGKKPPPDSWNSIYDAMRYIKGLGSGNYWGVNQSGRDMICQFEQMDLSDFSRNHKIFIGEQSFLTEFQLQ